MSEPTYTVTVDSEVVLTGVPKDQAVAEYEKHLKGGEVQDTLRLLQVKVIRESVRGLTETVKPRTRRKVESKPKTDKK